MGYFPKVSESPADQEKEKERALKGEADYLEPWCTIWCTSGEIVSIHGQ